jgi:hypothetical protein
LFVDEGPRIRLADDGVIARPRALRDYPEQSEAPAFAVSTKYCHPEQSEGPAFAVSTNSIVILSEAKDLLLLPATNSIVILSEAKDLLLLPAPTVLSS